MKKTVIILCAFATLLSCKSLKEEWDPVFTTNYKEPHAQIGYSESYLQEKEGLETFTTIADLKAMYKNKPLVLSGNVWVKGQVTSEDRSGNIYKEIYIQDETGGIDLKLGKTSLYSEYSRGQWLYVKCDGLTLGAYKGMPQLGFEADDTTTNEYETSYIDLQAYIDQHVFKGLKDKALAPEVVDEAAIAASIAAGFQGALWGKLVTVKNLTYGSTKGIKEIFALFYPNPNLPHKTENPENRVFLSTPLNDSDLIAGFDYTWGVDTWSCSKSTYIEFLTGDKWDKAEVGSGSTHYGTIATATPRNAGLEGKTLDSFGMDADLTFKEIMIKYASANYISHYFKVGSTNVQVRSSGFAKFCDEKIPANILGGAPVDITGIFTIYDGKAQFTLVDEPSVSVVLSE
ncbi:MAG: OB-fold nucleic acid binding domain-containing protein [Bacteroidales bacterium]|nr:OB-fold nucleic acid binding domain-containing protein [Bacteroidales bacterium]